MYKLIIKILNGSKHELPLNHPCYNELIDQIKNNNISFVEEYIHTEIYWYMRLNELWDATVEEYYLLDPKCNKLVY